MIRGGCVLSCSLKHGVDRTLYGILLEGELVGALIPSVNEHFNTCIAYVRFGVCMKIFLENQF